LDRSRYLRLMVPGYILSPHPRLVQADRTTGPYSRNMHTGRGRPAEEVFADVRGEFNLPPDA